MTKLDVPTVEDIDADEESSRSSHKSNLQSSRASPTTSIQNQQQQHQEKEAQAGSRIIVCANGRPVRQTVNEFAIRCDSMRTAVAHRRMRYICIHHLDNICYYIVNYCEYEHLIMINTANIISFVRLCITDIYIYMSCYLVDLFSYTQHRLY